MDTPHTMETVGSNGLRERSACTEVGASWKATSNSGPVQVTTPDHLAYELPQHVKHGL